MCITDSKLKSKGLCLVFETIIFILNENFVDNETFLDFNYRQKATTAENGHGKRYDRMRPP